MNTKHFSYYFKSFGLVSLGGTLLHFIYDWTNNSIWAACISGVNESTWEHMKLFYWPMFLLALIHRPYFREDQNYWSIKLLSIVVGLSMIPMLYYTYNGMFGKSPDWVNISIFYIAVGFSFILEWRLFNNHTISSEYFTLPFYLIVVLGVLFIVFTFYAPKIPLFQDPISGTYGITHGE